MQRSPRPNASLPQAWHNGLEGGLAGSINLEVLEGVGAINVAAEARTGRLDKVSIEQGPHMHSDEIGIGEIIVPSSITNAAIDDLKLAAGKDAYAVIKASDVMI